MIVLARHAHSIQAKGQCVGRTDVPLSDQGMEQALQLAEALGSISFLRVCSSPARRARNTLAPLAVRLGLESEIIPELDEIAMGDWDGLFFDDIRVRFPREYVERGEHFGDFRSPGGESFNDVADRAMTALIHLAAGDQPVFMVSHAGVIRSVLCRMTGHPMDDLFWFKPKHGSCTIIAPAPDGLKLVATGVAPGDIASFLQP